MEVQEVIKLNSKVKFESLTTPGRGFRGRVYGVVDESGIKYALIQMTNGGPLNRSYVAFDRLSEDK